MKIYNKPEIETLALEMIDVITASFGGGEESGTTEEKLQNAGVPENQIKTLEESIDDMQVDNWGW